MKYNIFSMAFLLLLDCCIYLIKINGKKLSMEYGQKQPFISERASCVQSRADVVKEGFQPYFSFQIIKAFLPCDRPKIKFLSKFPKFDFISSTKNKNNKTV